MLDCTGCTVTVSIFQRCQGVSTFQCLEFSPHAVNIVDVRQRYELCPEPNGNCCYSWGAMVFVCDYVVKVFSVLLVGVGVTRGVGTGAL